MIASPAGSDDALASAIANGARLLDLSLDAEQVRRLVTYLRLIERWNSTYNLTSVRDAAEMVTHHVLDSLAAGAALVRHRAGARTRRLLDVGSGAGLPGIALAIAFPELDVTCAESVGKKAAFISQVVGAVPVPNAEAAHVRVEGMLETFDVVASRAFASLQRFVDLTRARLAENGEWMAMKGKVPTAEIGELRDVRCTVEMVSVPGLSADRCIVWMRPF